MRCDCLTATGVNDTPNLSESVARHRSAMHTRVMSSTTNPTHSPIVRTIDDVWTCADGTRIELGRDECVVTGEHGKTKATGCLGVSESGRYRVYVTFRHGHAVMRSSRVVEADSGIAAAIIAADAAGGSYLTCDAGTYEAG